MIIRALHRFGGATCEGGCTKFAGGFDAAVDVIGRNKRACAIVNGDELRVGRKGCESGGDRILTLLAAIDADHRLGEIFVLDLVPAIQRADHHDRLDALCFEKRVDAPPQDSDAVERPCEFVMAESAAVACGDDDRGA